jgi:hypothetical protein
MKPKKFETELNEFIKNKSIYYLSNQMKKLCREDKLTKTI